MADAAYLFQIVLEATDSASPAILAVRDALAGLGVPLQTVGTLATQTGKQQEDAAAKVATAEQQAAQATQQAAAQQVTSYQQSAQAATSFAQGVAQGLGVLVPLSLAAATAKIVGFFKDAVQSFADYDRGIREIVTLTGQVGAAGDATYGRITDQIRQFSVAMGVNATQATKALYEIMSSGVNDPVQAMDVLHAATLAAIGGVTTLKTAADAIVTALNAYGMSADQATHVSDVLFSAVKDGRVRWDELGNSIGLVLPTAHLAGVSLEEVAGALAAMTNQGTPTQTAMIQLNQLLTAIIKPSSEAKTAAHDLGVEFNLQGLAAKGLIPFLQDIYDKAGGNIDQIAQLIPNIRAARGAYELMGQGAQEATTYIDNATKSMGNSTAAAEEVNQSGARAFEQFQSQAAELERRIGEGLLPVARDLVTTISLVGEKLGAWPSQVPSDEQIDRVKRLDQSAQGLADTITVVVGAFHALNAAYQFFGGAENPFRRLGSAIASVTTVPLVKSLKEGQAALGESTASTNAYADAEAKLTARMVAGEEIAGGWTRALNDARNATADAADHQAQLAEKAGNAATIIAQETRAAAAAAKAADEAARAAAAQGAAVKELTDAQERYQEILGNIAQLEASGAIASEEADKRRERAKADLDKATKASADATTAADAAIREQLRLAEAGAVSFADFGQSLLDSKNELKGLTESGYQAKLKEIADAVAFGAISAQDATAQVKALASAYSQQLTTAANEAAQAAKQAADALARALETEATSAQKFGQDVAKDLREAYQQVDTIQKTHDDATNQAIADAQATQQAARETADAALLAEAQSYGDAEVKLSQDTTASLVADQQSRALQLSRLAEDRARTEAQAEATYNAERVANRTQANETLKAIDDKYGVNGSGGQQGADDQKARDQAIADARDDLAKKSAALTDKLSQDTHDTDAARDQALAVARDKELQAEATARQQLADTLAASEQRQLQALADEVTKNADAVTGEAQKLLDSLTRPDSKADQAARDKAAADETTAYAQRLADEQAAYRKNLAAVQNTTELTAEERRHQQVLDDLKAEHQTALGGIQNAPDSKQHLAQQAADEQAAYQKQLADELARHEQQRQGATTDEAKAQERDRYAAAVRQLDDQHAQRLKQLAEESGLLTDAQKKEADAAFAQLDREHRQRLSDLQDEADARKKAADDAYAAAVKTARAQEALDLATAERTHQAKLDQLEAERVAQIKVNEDTFKEFVTAQGKAHQKVLDDIKARYETERTAALTEQNKRFKEIDDTEAKEKTARKNAYDLQDTREREDFALRQQNTGEHFLAELNSIEGRHTATVKRINDQADAAIDASNRALTKKQEQIDTQRTNDYQKFDQDLRDRFSDLQTQFADAMGKLDKLIPDDVRRVLQQGAALIGGAVRGVETAITTRDSSAVVGAGGGTAGELVSTGTPVDQFLNLAPEAPAGGSAYEQAAGDFADLLAQIQQQLSAAQKTIDAADKQAFLTGVVGGDAGALTNPAPSQALPSGSSAGSALNWALARVGQAIYEGMCERFVENAYGTSGVFPSAWAAANALLDHPGGTLGDAPPGALVFFRPDASNAGYGHVGISEGGGKFVSALYSGVAVQPASAYWNSLYAGWGEPAFARRAFGGDVAAGQGYIVGDAGKPEYFMPSQPGTVFPDVPAIDYDRLAHAVANAMRGVLAAVQPARSRAPVTINTTAADPQSVLRLVTQWSHRQDLLDQAVLHGTT